jgi:hypothetical protein
MWLQFSTSASVILKVFILPSAVGSVAKWQSSPGGEAHHFAKLPERVRTAALWPSVGSMQSADGSLVFTDCIGTLTAHQRFRSRAAGLSVAELPANRNARRSAVIPPQRTVVLRMKLCRRRRRSDSRMGIA